MQQSGKYMLAVVIALALLWAGAPSVSRLGAEPVQPDRTGWIELAVVEDNGSCTGDQRLAGPYFPLYSSPTDADYTALRQKNKGTAYTRIIDGSSAILVYSYRDRFYNCATARRIAIQSGRSLETLRQTALRDVNNSNSKSEYREVWVWGN